MLSIVVALLAGSLDAMLWQEARREARRAFIEQQAAFEHVDRTDARPNRVEMPVQRTHDPQPVVRQCPHRHTHERR